VFNLYFSEDKCVECLRGPKDSHLLVFRSSEQAPNTFQGKNIEDIFAVLDTELGTWIAVIGLLVAGTVGVLKAMSMDSGVDVLFCLLGSVAAFGAVYFICFDKH